MGRCDKLVDVGRRGFFAKTAAVAAGAPATTAMRQARAAPSLALVAYPSTKLANISELKVNEPKNITYPDASPGVLIKLGSRVEGGAGPDGDIVAFSILCPQQGLSVGVSGGRQNLQLSWSLQPVRCRERWLADFWSRDAELTAVPAGRG